MTRSPGWNPWGLAGLLLALSTGPLTACAPTAELPAAPVPAGPEIRVVSTPVPLDPGAPERVKVGAFAYAGGVALTDPVTDRLHGLSDLKFAPDGTLVAVSDFGDLFEGRLVLDAAGQLTGVTDGKVWPLKRPDGQPVQGKAEGDAEGLVLLAGGDRLVSFERQHRIWLYPAQGGPPRPAPMPTSLFSENEGLEALTAYPVAGPDAYLAGSEEGEIWLCRLSAACDRFAALLGPDQDYGLTALASFGDGSLVTVHRTFDPIRGARVLVSVYPVAMLKARNPRPSAVLTLEGSLTRDNMEGVALITAPSGAARLLLLADDNGSPQERTLLMAFDWVGGR